MVVDTNGVFYRRNSVLAQDVAYSTALGNRLGAQIDQIPTWGFWKMPAGVGPNNPHPAKVEAKGRGAAALLQQGVAITLKRVYILIGETRLKFNVLYERKRILEIEPYIQGSPAFQRLFSTALAKEKERIRLRHETAEQILDLMGDRAKELDTRIERLRKKLGGKQ